MLRSPTRSTVADAELLVAAGILSTDDDGYTLARDEPLYRDGVVLANAVSAYLRRALQHAEGGAAGWDGQDADLVLRQGRSSVRIVGVLAAWFPQMPSVEAAFRAGTARFLDVGVGVGAISIGLCQRFPGVTCVGLDVVPEVLVLGRAEVEAAGLSDRIELRELSVADLADDAAYDLGWLPQPFIPRPAFEAGVGSMFRALRPDGLDRRAADDAARPRLGVRAGHRGPRRPRAGRRSDRGLRSDRAAGASGFRRHRP